MRKRTTVPFDALRVAQVCHEAHRAYCAALGETDIAPPWAALPSEAQGAIADGVRAQAEDPEAGPGATHLAWVRAKRQQGWTTLEIKDAEAKTHPGLQLWENLDPTEQAKDRLFRAIIFTLHGTPQRVWQEVEA